MRFNEAVVKCCRAPWLNTTEDWLEGDTSIYPVHWSPCRRAKHHGAPAIAHRDAPVARPARTPRSTRRATFVAQRRHGTSMRPRLNTAEDKPPATVRSRNATRFNQTAAQRHGGRRTLQRRADLRSNASVRPCLNATEHDLRGNYIVHVVPASMRP